MKYGLAWIRQAICRLHLEKILLRDHATWEMTEILYRRQNPENMFWNIWCKRIFTILLLLVLTVIVAIFCQSRDTSEKVVTQGEIIEREDAAKTVHFGVEADTEEGLVQEEVTLRVAERKFTEKECQDIEKKVDSYIKETLCGENTSLDQVVSPLCFPDTVPGTKIQIRWQREEKYIDEKGNILYTLLPKEGAEIIVSAVASWNNWEKEYYFRIFLMKAELPLTEELRSEIRASVETAVLSQSTEQEIHLPKTVSGRKVRYINLQEPKDFSAVYAMIGIMLLLPFFWKRKQKEAMERREEELELDYPELVNKIMLLLSAGLTVRGSFERMDFQYRLKRKEGGSRRYVYEEVCVCCQEMKNGMTEARAIENFGKRCRQMSYLRLASLLNQNIRKGAEGLTELLETEAMEAFEKRKEAVKQMGEKAGTKLLFPMILMLGIVMAIIIVPAFMTM